MFYIPGDVYENVGGAWGGATDDDSVYSNTGNQAQKENPKEERGYRVRYISILYAENYIVYTLYIIFCHYVPAYYMQFHTVYIA